MRGGAKKVKAKTGIYIAGGAATGAANGLFGGGGGMIAVPFLEGAARLPARRAHATAIAVILPASLVSSIVYLLFGLVPMNIFLPTALGVGAGGFLGAKLLARIPAKAVTVAFALFMFAAGVRMLF